MVRGFVGILGVDHFTFRGNTMNTDTIGDISEVKILSRLLELGYTVSVPWGKNQRYDLIVDTGDTLIRAQCKTGRLRDGVVRFNTSSHSRYGDKDYKGQIEWFLIYCPDTNETYCVLEKDAGTSEMFLRVEEPLSNHSSIRWAKDYKL